MSFASRNFSYRSVTGAKLEQALTPFRVGCTCCSRTCSRSGDLRKFLRQIVNRSDRRGRRGARSVSAGSDGFVRPDCVGTRRRSWPTRSRLILRSRRRHSTAHSRPDSCGSCLATCARSGNSVWPNLTPRLLVHRYAGDAFRCCTRGDRAKQAATILEREAAKEESASPGSRRSPGRRPREDWSARPIPRHLPQMHPATQGACSQRRDYGHIADRPAAQRDPATSGWAGQDLRCGLAQANQPAPFEPRLGSPCRRSMPSNRLSLGCRPDMNQRAAVQVSGTGEYSAPSVDFGTAPAAIGIRSELRLGRSV